MTLVQHLSQHIATHGPMPLETFMQQCLYHPQFGYYTNLQHLGEAGDFTTAPQLTPLFGGTLANWVAAQWQRLGSPSPFTLAEAGPGSGALMQGLLAHLFHAHPACANAAHVILLETSPSLTTRQQETLNGYTIHHAPSLTHLPPHSTILIANELLDAFPIRQYHRNGEAWEQTAVTVSNGALAFTRIPAENPPLPKNWQPEDDAIFEHSPAAHQWLGQLQAHLSAHAGTALLIDYGYATLPPQGGDTLQAIHRHAMVDALHLPGQADLTAHVNFAQVAETLSPTHCTLANMADFLMANGLLALAEPVIEQPATANALQRLLHPAQMGAMFKVLHYRPANHTPTG